MTLEQDLSKFIQQVNSGLEDVIKRKKPYPKESHFVISLDDYFNFGDDGHNGITFNSKCRSCECFYKDFYIEVPYSIINHIECEYEPKGILDRYHYDEDLMRDFFEYEVIRDKNFKPDEVVYGSKLPRCICDNDDFYDEDED